VLICGLLKWAVRTILFERIQFRFMRATSSHFTFSCAEVFAAERRAGIGFATLGENLCVLGVESGAGDLVAAPPRHESEPPGGHPLSVHCAFLSAGSISFQRT
jgi:hypothetical protein